MDVTYDRCAGLDVHKKTVVACVMSPEGQETRTFNTMTQDLLEMADWLVQRQVTHVAMESSGVFWKPIYNLLEGLDLTLLVVNARHIKAVPGRKTDVKDAEWIADLLRHGLLRGSYIPDRSQRELREVVRYRRNLVGERARTINRIQQVLEGANIKLSSVATDIIGVSGRAMLEQLARGSEDAEAMAALAKGRMRHKRLELEQALRGLMGSHQRMLLQSQLRHLDFLGQEIAQLDDEVAARMGPFEEAIQQLDGLLLHRKAFQLYLFPNAILIQHKISASLLNSPSIPFRHHQLPQQGLRQCPAMPLQQMHGMNLHVKKPQ